MKNNISTPTDGFPEPVQHKSCLATIYRNKNRGVHRYEVRFHDAEGVRQRASFPDYADAKDYATGLVRQLAKGGLDLLTLRGSERRVYEHALEVVRPTGLELDVAVGQFAQMARLLNGAGTLQEAVEFFIAQRPKRSPSITVQAVVDQFIEAKKSDGVGRLYLRDLRTRLGRFAKAFRCPISGIRTPEILLYLDALKVGKRTRKNHLDSIGVLLEYCKAKEYLPDSHPGISKVQKPCLEAPQIEILTPEEMAKLLNAAHPLILPVLALQAFAGIRAQEMTRLDWGHVKWEQGHIEIPARVAKTKVRRLVPISDNLRAWLAPLRRASGPIVSYNNLNTQFRKVAKSAGVKLKRNGFRHSYISYRVAVTKNMPQTALEAGNSVAIIQTNYLEVVTEQQGRQWFSITPNSPTNLIDLPQAQTVPVPEQQKQATVG